MLERPGQRPRSWRETCSGTKGRGVDQARWRPGNGVSDSRFPLTVASSSQMNRSRPTSSSSCFGCAPSVLAGLSRKPSSNRGRRDRTGTDQDQWMLIRRLRRQWLLANAAGDPRPPTVNRFLRKRLVGLKIRLDRLCEAGGGGAVECTMIPGEAQRQPRHLDR